MGVHLSIVLSKWILTVFKLHSFILKQPFPFVHSQGNLLPAVMFLFTSKCFWSFASIFDGFPFTVLCVAKLYNRTFHYISGWWGRGWPRLLLEWVISNTYTTLVTNFLLQVHKHTFNINALSLHMTHTYISQQLWILKNYELPVDTLHVTFYG